MKRQVGNALVRMALVLACAGPVGGCRARKSIDETSGAPPPAAVTQEEDEEGIDVRHLDRFPVVTATAREVAPDLSVTGAVAADPSRQVPVVSLASGRVVDLRARLGDEVSEGQLLLRIQSADVSTAFSDYQKAHADEVLARGQLDRATALYARGAIAQKDLEVAQDAADKATVDVGANAERLHVLGSDASQPPTSIVDITAPASGVITEENVTDAAGVKSLDNSPNLFTISDLSRVWIVCDVYENDLPNIGVGDTADIHATAYPRRALTGRISSIGPILDPNMRTARVRIELSNPGFLRLGMFVTATFHGQASQRETVVPASAILHLHDRDWVYVPDDRGRVQRLEVVGGSILPGNVQALRSGLRPGQRVVANALALQSTIEQ